MSNQRTYDIVLFGASGFTGQLTAQYLAKYAGKLRWALAGRNVEKLKQVRASLDATTSQPEIVEANAGDAAGTRALAQSTRVLITTVGPYSLYGEPLVAACVDAGTDYVDLCGEPGFVAQMTARYNSEAAEKQLKIVHACGFDSIPHDLGVLFTLNALQRRMTPAEIASTPVTIEGFVRASGTVSGGTWQSMLQIMHRGNPPSPGAPPQAGRAVGVIPPRLRYQKELGLWAVPLPTIDPQVVCHSARLLPSYGPNFRYGHYLGLKYLPQVLGLGAGFAALFALAQWRPTRELLAKVKRSGEGPSAAQRDKSFFRVVFLGAAGSQRVRCQVRGGDPGYGETAKMLAESALCLAFDRERLPAQYGVVPPAAALGDVLIERLQRAGLIFEELARDAS